MIYEYAFDTAVARHDVVDPGKYPLPAALLNSMSSPNVIVTEAANGLTFTCRQLRAETAGYSKTYKHLDWYAKLSFVGIVSKIGEDKARDIVSICLPQSDSWHMSFMSLDEMLENRIVGRAHFRSLQCVEAIPPRPDEEESFEETIRYLCGRENIRVFWR
jgi:hypothetical protein